MKKLPDKFITYIHQRLGNEADSFFDAIQEAPNLSIRVNPKKNGNIQFPDMEQVPWCENGYYLPKRPSFVFDPLYHAGCYYAQEASSMVFPNFLSDISTPLKVLDLCAAPGGKSSLLLSILPEGSLLVSNELVGKRNDILYENLVKWGSDNVIITQNRSSDFLYLGSYFDVILVDAPCSGEGMFRKDEDAVAQWSPSLVNQCANIQQTLLFDAQKLLKDGGILIYSTCTFEAQENEQNIKQFIENGNLEITPLPLPQSHEWGLTAVEITNELQGYYAYPHKTRGEGLFVCAFQVHKKEKSYAISDRNNPYKKLTNADLYPTYQSLLPDDFQAFLADTNVYAIKSDFYRDLLRLHKLRIQKSGIKLYELTNKSPIPTHELAMQFAFDIPFSTLELDLHTALEYQKGLNIGSMEGGTDWIIYTYKGIKLGFGKNIGSRINNNYPKSWRIRKQLLDV